MKDHFAAVYFGPDESKEQRVFLEAMAGVMIINLSYNEIKEHMVDFERERAGAINRLVLSSEKQIEDFKRMMSVYLPNKEYKITDDPDDETFAKWLKDKKEHQ